MMISWLLPVLLALVAAAWWFAQRGRGAGWLPPGRDPAEEVLRERFARGEIDEQTYLRQLETLRRTPA